MFKYCVKSLFLIAVFISFNVQAEKAAVATKSNYEIGKHIGNLIGVGYGAKLMYNEVQPSCTKLINKDSFKDVLIKWESRNDKVVSMSQALWDKTVSTIEELNKKKTVSAKQKELYSNMLSQFSSMINTIKTTIVDKMAASPQKSQINLCNNIIKLFNSKKLDVINRDKALYDKLLSWDINVYESQLLKMLQAS